MKNVQKCKKMDNSAYTKMGKVCYNFILEEDDYLKVAGIFIGQLMIRTCVRVLRGARIFCLTSGGVCDIIIVNRSSGS